MASGVEELLDMLFEMIDEAKNAPLSSDKCVIERDRALDLIDDIRSQFPMELSEAKKMMANRAEIIASTKREAEAIRKAAEDKARSEYYEYYTGRTWGGYDPHHLMIDSSLLGIDGTVDLIASVADKKFGL